MMFPGGYMDPAWMGWMGIGSLLLWAGLLGLAAFVAVRLTRPRAESGRGKELLDERLARGEIEPDEYRAKRALIEA